MLVGGPTTNHPNEVLLSEQDIMNPQQRWQSIKIALGKLQISVRRYSVK